MADGGAFLMESFTPSPETTRAFRTALGQFATGVTLVTCRSDSGPVGLIANSFASVSLDPPLVLWSPARGSRRFPAFQAATEFAIHILSTDQHMACHAFARDGAAFETVSWQDNDRGVPLIADCLARFECTRAATHDGGDHLIIVGRVTRAEIGQGEPLLFAKGAYGRFTDDG